MTIDSYEDSLPIREHDIREPSARPRFPQTVYAVLVFPRIGAYGRQYGRSYMEDCEAIRQRYKRGLGNSMGDKIKQRLQMREEVLQ